MRLRESVTVCTDFFCAFASLICLGEYALYCFLRECHPPTHRESSLVRESSDRVFRSGLAVFARMCVYVTRAKLWQSYILPCTELRDGSMGHYCVGHNLKPYKRYQGVLPDAQGT